MLSEVEGASGGSLVTGSEVLEEEVSGGGDRTLCPGEGMVPEGEAELRVAMVDGGLLRQEQAHVKVAREGVVVMQAMSLQGGADPMSMTLRLLLARTCTGPNSMLSPGRALPPGL